jgi:hypothetical protein
MMPLAGGVLGVMQRENSMITLRASPASTAFTEATHSRKSLFRPLCRENATALAGPPAPRCEKSGWPAGNEAA